MGLYNFEFFVLKLIPAYILSQWLLQKSLLIITNKLSMILIQ